MTEVVSVENMRKSDEYTGKNLIPFRELMARAGKAIFETAEWRPPVAVVCGVGNNAGDGFAAAALMMEADIPCTVFMLSEKISETSKYFYDECVRLGVDIKHGIDELCLDGYNSVLDCIFGTGFKGTPKEPYRTAIERINKSGAFTVSADINSGLDGNSGICEDICVDSDLTVSIGTFKSGLFLNSAKDHIKSKVNCPIGIELLDPPYLLIDKEDIRHLFCHRPNDSNKGDYGYVALIGGSLKYSGAAKLSNLALSALRSGAGVAKLAVPDCILDGVLPYVLETTLFPLDSENGEYRFNENKLAELSAGTSAIAVGMGMGRSGEVEKLLNFLLWEYHGRLIIDADGLNVLSGMDKAKLKNASCKVILTPHPKEFERISQVPVSDVLRDPISYAKAYAAETGTILLLKGPTTVVTDGDTVYLADRGCAGMATAGSGDVLSGILAGICGYTKTEALLLGVSAGAYLAGLSGEIAAKEIPMVSMTAGDTVRAIPQAMKEILS